MWEQTHKKVSVPKVLISSFSFCVFREAILETHYSIEHSIMLGILNEITTSYKLESISALGTAERFFYLTSFKLDSRAVIEVIVIGLPSGMSPVFSMSKRKS